MTCTFPGRSPPKPNPDMSPKVELEVGVFQLRQHTSNAKFPGFPSSLSHVWLIQCHCNIWVNSKFCLCVQDWFLHPGFSIHKTAVCLKTLVLFSVVNYVFASLSFHESKKWLTICMLHSSSYWQFSFCLPLLWLFCNSQFSENDPKYRWNKD